VRLFETFTGGHLAIAEIFDGMIVMGVFGGDSDEAVDGVVDAFIDYMKKYMST
jgi:hypothetical protein